MNASKLALTLVASLAAGQAVAQSSFTAIPGAFSAEDVTPDGTIVVGSGAGGGYYWRWQTDPAPVAIGGLSATGVSDDGTVICGNITDPVTGAEIAGRWTQATGWVSIGALPNAMQCPSLSSAYDISGDGTVIVGLSWDGCDGRAFKWQQGIGMIPLQVLGLGQNRASAIAENGSIIGGFSQQASRTPATWTPPGVGTELDPTAQGEIYSFSDTGSRTVGQWNSQGFYKDGANPVVLLPYLDPNSFNGNATDTNEAGDRVIGYEKFGGFFGPWAAVVWDTTTNTGTALLDLLAGAGVTNLPAEMSFALACSADGKVIVGQTQFGGAWIAELGDCVTGSSNFCSTAPNSVSASGALISASGSFNLSAIACQLTAAPVPNQPGIFYYGSSQANGGAGFPFGDGLRCVGGPQVYRLPPTTAAGNTLNYVFDYTVPPASLTLDAGETWYFQAWYRDPAAGGATFNLSDGLAITFCD